MIHDLRLAHRWLWFPAAVLSAHDIPTDVSAHLFVKPAGQTLHVLARVPLKVVRDMEFPEQGRTGYLDLDRLRPLLPDAATLWVSDFIAIHEDGAALPRPRLAAVQISLASDRSFDSFDAALAHTTGPPLANSASAVWSQVFFDIALEYPIRSDRARFSVRPGLQRLGERVVTTLRFLPPGGEVRAFQFDGDPGLVPLDPRWHQAAARFIHSGFSHILDGADHLLFLACLVIPFRRLRPLALIVTGFTLAHSITLIASAYGMAPSALWFPPFIETLIAASIVFMALENIVGVSAPSRRWTMALAFGLVHGFGFSFALRETLQFAGSHHLAALVAFNVGVELGQLLVLLVLIPLLGLLFRHIVAERMGTIILSAFVAHTGWHWMLERWDVLRLYPFEWAALDAAALASAMRWLIVFLLVAALARAVGRKAGPFR